jgi:PAS domain S-box-containing protein
MNDGLLVADNDDAIQFVNEKLCKMFGYTQEELIGNIGYRILLPEEHWNLLQEKNRQRMQGISETYDLEMKKKSGQRFWASVSASPIYNPKGEVIGSTATLSDTTERKRAEAALQKHDKRYKTVIENIFKFVPEGILVFTDKLKLFNRNKTFDDIVRTYSSKLEYTEQELAEIIIEEVKRRLTGEMSTTIRIPKKKHEQRENRTDYSIKNP